MTIPPEAFAERIDSQTALVATTHLFYTTGYLQDVRAIADAAHAAGALCVIDGYQTCGCVPLDVEEMGCDAFVGGCLKWLSGGPGNAFLYVRPELIPRCDPRAPAGSRPATPSPSPSRSSSSPTTHAASRPEPGRSPATTPGWPGLELILEVGVANIQERLRDLTDRILERCDDAGVEDLHATRARAPLRHRDPGVRPARRRSRPRSTREGVIVDSRPGRVRLSPHWCVTEDELERGMDLVLGLVRPPSSSRAHELS